MWVILGLLTGVLTTSAAAHAYPQNNPSLEAQLIFWLFLKLKSNWTTLFKTMTVRGTAWWREGEWWR